MNIVLQVVPFFLAARVTVDLPWMDGPVYTFEVQVNSTAIPEGSYTSIRLNVASKLVCQPKGYLHHHVLSCHFEDSIADSFVTEVLDPSLPGLPASPVNRQMAYEIYPDQFEIKFTEQGLHSLLVNENIQPLELEMIRVIVGQLNIGSMIPAYEDTFEAMENFTQGECATIFSFSRHVTNQPLHRNRGYVLETIYGVTDGQLLQIRKVRNLNMCTHNVPYFFGSADTTRQYSDVTSSASSSESHIVFTSTEFMSGTTNVITIIRDYERATLYENINLRLDTILAAKDRPPEVKNPERVSMFIGGWTMESPQRDNFSMRT
ncbi:vitellogenin [Ptiloglossa arizonensis]|uniref:vitellogenin n=1 Tax=Ptiloglossa arizonensis TaxID=3350558 RepID=UPI003F9FC220